MCDFRDQKQKELKLEREVQKSRATRSERSRGSRFRFRLVVGTPCHRLLQPAWHAVAQGPTTLDTRQSAQWRHGIPHIAERKRLPTPGGDRLMGVMGIFVVGDYRPPNSRLVPDKVNNSKLFLFYIDIFFYKLWSFSLQSLKKIKYGK